MTFWIVAASVTVVDADIPWLSAVIVAVPSPTAVTGSGRCGGKGLPRYPTSCFSPSCTQLRGAGGDAGNV
jgi:hypothetical protein